MTTLFLSLRAGRPPNFKEYIFASLMLCMHFIHPTAKTVMIILHIIFLLEPQESESNLVTETSLYAYSTNYSLLK